jgi:cell division transport system ATP-binding protein
MDTTRYLRTRRPPVLLEHVTITYPGAKAPTLSQVSVHVGVGEFVSIVGASGAGKTLLKVLTGQMRPTSGLAVVAGIDLATMPGRYLPRLRRRIGVTFQDARLLPGRTAVENIAYALELTGVPYRAARARALEALAQIGSEHLGDLVPEKMSGGEAQRVGIARALAGRPLVLLADEPTGNLDPVTARLVVDALAQVADSGTAVVMVTHDDASVDRLGRRVIHLAGGTIRTDLTDVTYAQATSEIPIVTAELLTAHSAWPGRHRHQAGPGKVAS